MSEVDCGLYVRPYPGEVKSGDAALVYQDGDKIYVAIVDVLGHGILAHQLTPQITSYLKKAAFLSPGEALSGLHEHLRGSRGAAVGLSLFDLKSRKFYHCGVGNTVTRKLGSNQVRYTSKDGIVGEIMTSPREQQCVLQKGDLFLYYSDGITDHFDEKDYPGIWRDSAEKVARTIVEKFGKEHDDSSCVAVRILA